MNQKYSLNILLCFAALAGIQGQNIGINTSTPKYPLSQDHVSPTDAIISMMNLSF